HLDRSAHGRFVADALGPRERRREAPAATRMTAKLLVYRHPLIAPKHGFMSPEAPAVTMDACHEASQRNRWITCSSPAISTGPAKRPRGYVSSMPCWPAAGSGRAWSAPARGT